jgi:hypothetical protein
VSVDILELTLYREPSVAMPQPSSRMPCLDTTAAIPQALKRAARVPINCASLPTVKQRR